MLLRTWQFAHQKGRGLNDTGGQLTPCPLQKVCKAWSPLTSKYDMILLWYIYINNIPELGQQHCISQSHIFFTGQLDKCNFWINIVRGILNSSHFFPPPNKISNSPYCCLAYAQHQATAVCDKTYLSVCYSFWGDCSLLQSLFVPMSLNSNKST